MRDITILMDTTQGRPARLLEALFGRGVNVDAGCLFPRTESRVMHIAVEDEDVEKVHEVAAELGVAVADDRECVVVPPGFPGGVAAIGSRVAEAGVTVNLAYFGASGQVVLSTTQLDKTREALGL
ncbi:MAG TPA: hypothetical protein VF246_04290 [Acidimicrobiia bacterium]|jgi:hypothetical protein